MACQADAANIRGNVNSQLTRTILKDGNFSEACIWKSLKCKSNYWQKVTCTIWEIGWESKIQLGAFTFPAHIPSCASSENFLPRFLPVSVGNERESERGSPKWKRTSHCAESPGPQDIQGSKARVSESLIQTMEW